MSYAIIDQNNIVENIAEANEPLGPNWLLNDGSAQIGGLWDGAHFHPAPPPAPIVPGSVSRFQALAALSNAGLLTAATNAVNASGNVVTQLAWANAQEFQRNSPTIAALGAALSLTPAQIDALFIAAAQIVA